MRYLNLIIAGLCYHATALVAPDVHYRDALLAIRDDQSQGKIVARGSGGGGGRGGGSSSSSSSSSSRNRPSKTNKYGSKEDDSSSSGESDGKGNKLKPIPKGTKAHPIGTADRAKLKQMRRHRNNDNVLNELSDTPEPGQKVTGIHSGTKTRGKGKNKEEVPLITAAYSEGSHAISVDINNVANGVVPGKEPTFLQAPSSLKKEQRKEQQSGTPAVPGVAREEKINAGADRRGTGDEGTLIQAPLADSNKEMHMSRMQKRKAGDVGEVKYVSTRDPEEQIIPPDSPVLFSQGPNIADAPKTKNPNIYIGQHVKGDGRPRVKQTRSDSPMGTRLSKQNAIDGGYSVRDYRQREDFDATTIDDLAKEGFFKKDQSDSDDELEMLKARNIDVSGQGKQGTSVGIDRREEEIENISDRSNDNTETIDGSNDSPLTQDEVDIYVDYFYRAQANLTDTVWPYIENMVERSNNPSVYAAALSIFSDLTYAPMKVVGGGFSLGMHSFDWYEQRLIDEGATDEEMAIVFAEDGWLIDLYMDVWEQASQVANQDGFLDDLEYITGQLYDVDASLLPKEWLTVSAKDAEKFETFMTSSNATTAARGGPAVDTKTIIDVPITVANSGAGAELAAMPTGVGAKGTVAGTALHTEEATITTTIGGFTTTLTTKILRKTAVAETMAKEDAEEEGNSAEDYPKDTINDDEDEGEQMQ